MVTGNTVYIGIYVGLFCLLREGMERRLYDAAVEGDVLSLLSLIREDPLILDRCMVGSFAAETPLHIAAMLGHLEFTLELLSRKPELTGELDSRHASPLHLASAKGHLEVVKALVLANPEMCFACDRGGRNPLHVAVLKGKLDVLKDLVGARQDAARSRLDHGTTILHLCVENHQLEAVRYLVEIFSDDSEFINSKDYSGNTILHAAVLEKQIETITFLLATNGVEVNAPNVHGLTALDILANSRRDVKDMEIAETLRSAGALKSRDHDIKQLPVLSLKTTKTSAFPSKDSYDKKRQMTIGSSTPKESGNWANYFNKQEDWLDKQKNSLMVVAVLIATMAFQAGVSPPGGVWQETITKDDRGNPVDDPHTAGTSVFADLHFQSYWVFLISNTVGFIASLSIILLLVSGLPLKRRIFMWILMVTMWIAISSTAITYTVSLIFTMPSKEQGYKRFTYILYCAIVLWIGLMGFLLLAHTVRIIVIIITALVRCLLKMIRKSRSTGIGRSGV